MTPTELRIVVWKNGYTPVPIQGKNPGFRSAWNSDTNKLINEGYIEDWFKHYPFALNTGIMGYNTPGFDIDLIHPEAVEAIEEFLHSQWIERGVVMRRTGRAPKLLIPLRSEIPIKKKRITLVADDGGLHGIELIGDGFQWAAFGEHPDTKKDYAWHGGYSPLTIKRADLTFITPEEVYADLERAAEISLDFGFTLKDAKKKSSTGWERDPFTEEAPFDWKDHFQSLIDDDSNTKLTMAFAKGRNNPIAMGNMFTAFIEVLANDTDQARKERRRKNIHQQVASAFRKSSSNGTHSGDDVLEHRRADSIEPQSIHWLWPNRFAFGKMGIIAGLPDQGKGLLLWHIIAAVTTGGEWPCHEGVAPVGNVIVLEAEDDPHDTVIPRLIAAGADLSRVHLLNMVKVNGNGVKRMFNIATDLAMLRKKIEEIGNVSLIVIDPLSAYIGRSKDVDTYRDTDVRAVFSPFTDLAAELHVAVIAVMHFNKKSDVQDVVLRVSNSIAFTAAARHVYGVIKDPDPDQNRRLLVRGKNNAAPDTQKTVAYEVGVKPIGNDKAGAEIKAPYILFHPQPLDISADEAMRGNVGGRPSRERDEAEDFLRRFLADGPKPKAEVLRGALADGQTRATVYRAANRIGVVFRFDDLGRSTWSLPGSSRHD